MEVSLGSSFELETQLIIAFNESYSSEENFKLIEERIKQIQKMILESKSGLA
ncbi:four helix bundle protein [Aequorivita sp. Q41]|uniref:four helix bundle protein n=1 Tax=Aequorivita sp. Q41 TaxID=3153300 RepID=UPI003242F938